MVGTSGFEPPTTRTPSEYATRLRYVPIVQILSPLSKIVKISCNPCFIWLRVLVVASGSGGVIGWGTLSSDDIEFDVSRCLMVALSRRSSTSQRLIISMRSTAPRV